jgi:hypothetical protein
MPESAGVAGEGAVDPAACGPSAACAPSAPRSRGWTGALLRVHERWVRWVYAPALTLALWLFVRWLTRGGARDADASLARAGRRVVGPARCCEPGSPDALVAERFLAALQAVGDRAHFRALLAPERIRTTRRWMATLARIALLQELRQGLVGWLRARTGAPAVVLSEAQIAVAPDCELACTGCFARPGHGGREPTRASILRAVDEAAALGATAIHLIGKGEPLAPRARGLVVARAIAARPHLLFTIATGAAELDDDVIGALAAAGNTVVLVSVEGPAATHDARRGAGSFARALASMARLRARGVPFGFSTMVARTSLDAIAARAHVGALADAGCLLGAYVRYFPLAPDRADALRLRAEDVVRWRGTLAAARHEALIPLVDLDELEEDCGCRARLGKSVYIDATTGVVAPCLRVPFTPDGAPSLEVASLDQVLGEPFFAAHRARADERCHACGTDLERELADVASDLAAAGASASALVGYRARAGGSKAPRALPVISAASASSPRPCTKAMEP